MVPRLAILVNQMLPVWFFLSANLIVYQSLAQSATIFNYSIPEGLPSKEVYEVVQDRDGFLWFATDNGVVKYDGREMKLFQMEHGLTDPAVFHIQEDAKGRLWFHTFSGKLSYYENGKIYKYTYNDKLLELVSSTYLNSIYVDSRDQLWFATHVIWGKIDINGNVYKENIKPGEIYYQEIEGKFILGGCTRSDPVRSFHFNGQSYIISLEPINAFEGWTRGIKWKNNFYFSIDNYLFEFDGKKVRKVFSAQNPVISFSIDPDDCLWIGYTTNGVDRFETTDFREPWRLEFLKKSSVGKVKRDHENGLWITTIEKGVFYIPDFRIENYELTVPYGIVEVVARGKYIFFRDGNGANTIFYKLDKYKHRIVWEKKMKELGSLGSHIRKIDGDRLYQADISFNPNYMELPEELNLMPTGGSVTYNDSVIWFITGNDAPFLCKRNRISNATTGKRLDFMVRQDFRDDSLIFLAGRVGLFLYGTDLNLKSKFEQFSDDKISSITKLNDSTIVLTTIGNGFILLNKKNWSFKRYNKQNKFIANHVYCALKTDSSLWLGTEQGLAKINISSLMNDDPSYRLLSKRSGLINDKINKLVYSSPDVWAFADEGYSVIKENTIDFYSLDPRPYLKNITVNHDTLSDDSLMDLSHGQNNITISVGFISFSNRNILTRYRLNEKDEWNYSDDWNFEFYSLSPNEYNFQLEYSIDNVHWKTTPIAVQFNIISPWWQRWYTQLAAFMMFGMSIYLYVRHRSRRLYKQQQRLIQAEIETLERERNRIAKELHDGVATSLSAIKLMVNHLLRSHKEPMAGELDEHFLYTIKEIKGIIYGLTPPGLERDGLFAGLKNYIEKLNKTIPIKIHLDIQGKEIHEPELGLLSFRIIQELLSNAVRHASAKNISIGVNSKTNELSLVFKDDGIGFSYDPHKSGLGLANVESRVESVNGNLKFESGSSGTSYIISIPLNLS